jgi:hypothetical protein
LVLDMTNPKLSNPTREIKLPHSPDAERALLGCVLVNNRTLELVLSLRLTVDDLYVQSHRLIFRAILDLASPNGAGSTPFDIVTIIDALTKRGELKKAGGAASISSLIGDVVPDPGVIKNYVKIIKRGADQRKFLTDLQNATARTLAGDAETAKAELAANLGLDMPRAAEVTTDFSNPDGNKPGADASAQEQARKPEGLRGECPEISEAAYCPIARRYFELIEPTTESSRNFHLPSFLTMVGAALGPQGDSMRGSVYFVASENVHPIFYTVLCGAVLKERHGHRQGGAASASREARYTRDALGRFSRRLHPRAGEAPGGRSGVQACRFSNL